MKTAISIPDKIFQAAEKMAARLRISRSELYARAIGDYVERHKTDDVTARLNAVLEGEDSAVDPALAAEQSRIIAREDW